MDTMLYGMESGMYIKCVVWRGGMVCVACRVVLT